MLIFNTTYLVPTAVQNKWKSWINELHIPYMLESGYFEEPQVAKVITNDQQHESSFTVQFKINNMKILEQWHFKFATDFQEKCAQQFGTELVFFSTVLEIIE